MIRRSEDSMSSRTPRFAAFSAGATLCALAAAAATPPSGPPLLGFSIDASQVELARELSLDGRISKDDLRSWLEQLAARPHHVGSEWGRANALWMRDLFASWGYDARIETFEVLFPTPKLRRLEMVAPTRFRARLDEGSLAEDPTSKQKSEQLPGYNAYSADGDVEAELVYVNYGLPADYEELATRGIDVRGKIVLARYGGSWRGIKPKVAAEHGAIGCLIYSDPSGDGYTQGDVWPKGGWRSRDSVQRGSVADMPIYSGDPLTPGVGATKEAARLTLAEARTLARIPVLPISYGDAEPLLRALGGPMTPESWRGALPIPYRFGPGPARVHLALAFDWSLKPVHNVIAVLPGATLPDEWIVRGNHHDAWVNGALDPVSGMVALLAEAKAIGALAKQGFRPQRTLVYAAWDGEEAGLLGSTEWVETHAAELRDKAVAYLNTDSVSRGLLGVGGSQSLERLVNEVGRAVIDPERGVSVLARAKAASIAQGDDKTRADLRAREDLRIEALGSGSDFTPFLQHLGIAALNVGFGGEEQYGQYHSIYDSIAHFERFGDPGFDYVAKTAEMNGRLTLRLSEAEILPFTLDRTAEAIAGYAASCARSPMRCARPPRSGSGCSPSGASSSPPTRSRPCRAAAARPGAVPRVRAAAECGRALQPRRRRVRDGARRSQRARSRRRGPRRAQPLPAHLRAPADDRSRSPRPPLVPPSGGRAGAVHRLRRQDPAGNPRGDRAASLERSQRSGSRDRGSAR
jgi:N-acetylated-alpha-linked acidic dipeptidase